MINEFFVWFSGISMFFRLVFSILFIFWFIEMFFLPFNMNRIIKRLDKIQEELVELSKLVGKAELISKSNEEIMALIFGDILKNNQSSILRKKDDL